MSFRKRSLTRPRRRRRSRSGRKKQQQKLQDRAVNRNANRNSSFSRMVDNPVGFVADLTHDAPRKTAALALIAGVFEGLLLGLVVGGSIVLIYQLADGVGFWIYFINAGVGLIAKVVWAWFWVLSGQGMLIRVLEHIAQRVLKKDFQSDQLPNELPSQSSSTILVVVTVVAIATIFVTGNEETNVPQALSAPWIVCIISALTGLVVAVFERLSMPVVIQALVRDRHNYQEEMSKKSDGRR